ncbi:hypothetical protein LCGC14_2419880 [marine sediment metagenome]|uniref:Uncharacterized protein n=1 Tax=marine sediment metagenome TaxID=412755 RepID=A0A0F9BQ25_9ZZZZ
MFSFDFQVDHDILEAWHDAIFQSPQTTRVFIEVAVLGDVQRKVQAVDVYPGPVVYPIEWTSEAQRRFYFAVVAQRDNDGNIIPYERRGTFFDDVTVELDPLSLNLMIANPNPVARYVIGDDQQKFHANTGWRNPSEQYLDILIEAQDEIINAWYFIIDHRNLR